MRDVWKTAKMMPAPVHPAETDDEEVERIDPSAEHMVDMA